MSEGRIQSHREPVRLLKQHVAEVLAACEALREQHGPAPWRSTGDGLVDELARLHDLGKATAAFQSYIADPDRYPGDPIEKGHTLPSLALTAALSRERDAVATLSLALGVRGHHGAQPDDDESLHGPLKNDHRRAALLRQLPTIDREAVARATGVELPTLDAPNALVRAAIRTLRDALDAWRAMSPPEMLRARFVARAAYSMLLEADKAFLAVDRAVIRSYLHRPRPSLEPGLVDVGLASLAHTPMDALRERARTLSLEGFERHREAPVLTLTLPTGAGKTLIAARWALDERTRVGGGVDAPVVILALPMLSIVDQTERVWRTALGAGDDDGDTLLPFHSLSERAYDPELDRATADFFIDTWRSEVVVTTFDQLLLAMYSDKAKHAMRYHRLLNARIVIDEAQYVPPALWTAVSEGLRALTALGRTRVLAMSATPAPCLEGATEALADPAPLYEGLSRYELRFEHETPVGYEDFVDRTIARCRDHLTRAEGTLVTVNVRATAQETWCRLHAAGLDPLLLSGDMTPAHRLATIAAVKASSARVVVSTQCVEAGVDLDMHHVIRDLAPLDAIIQIAGRCNRHAHRDDPGTVTVVHLRNAAGRDDAGDVYDRVALQCTREVLRGRKLVAEREVLGLCRQWFDTLRERKYLGGEHVTRWARIEASLDVRALLRGEDEQVSVLVTEHDSTLKPALLAALAVPDRWARRAGLRALAPRIARHSVSVHPRVFAALQTTPLDPHGLWNELLPGQYHPLRGIDSRRRA